VPQTRPNPTAHVNGVIQNAAASRRWDAPAPLRFWHLASLDAPTVAVVWSLAFAWAAKVRLPVWIPLLLALAAWTAYVADRLLDVRAALRTGNLHNLRQRHWFHHRHRRLLGPLAMAAACAAACIVVSVMPVAACERNSVLAVAALAYFTNVHSSRRLRGAGLSNASLPSLVPLFKKELFVGLLFTAACALPAFSRALTRTSAPIWPLAGTAGFFATLAWLNCHAIERWETEPYQRTEEVSFSAAKQAAEKGIHSVQTQEKRAAGAKAHVDFGALSARLKSCPVTKPSGVAAETSFPAACKATVLYARFTRGLKPTTPSGSSATAACVLAVSGLLLAYLMPNPQPRSAALVLAGTLSSLMLALIDRLRDRLTPLALRVSADVVLLAPLALLVR
jgi:hypothetical protein